MTEIPRPLDDFERLRRPDRRGAVAVVRGYPDERDDVAVPMPAPVRTGREWECDRISVAHEHDSSEVTRDPSRQLGPRPWSGPGGTAAASVAVACCPPEERHAPGLMMVADVLRAEGLDVQMLGEGAPAEAIRAARPGLVVMAGGAAFAGDAAGARALGADHFAADARGARRLIRDLGKGKGGRES